MERSFDRSDIQQSLKILLKNPLQQLQQSQKIAQQFQQDAKKKSWLEKIELLQKYEEKYPIFLLNECNADGCLLSREKSVLRETFQEAVTEKLDKVLTSVRDRPASYTAFGSGDLFQELLIASFVLNKNQSASITFNFIDARYAPYIKLRMCDHGPCQIVADYSSFSDDLKSFDSNCFYEEARLRQFLKFLQNQFLKAELVVYAYDSTKDYLTLLEKKSIAVPDVLSAVDIQDEKSLMIASVLKYKELCYSLLKQNERLYNIWLKHDQDATEFSLRSYYFLKQKNKQREQFTYRDHMLPVPTEKVEDKKKSFAIEGVLDALSIFGVTYFK